MTATETITATPSNKTVHAPHSPSAHPSLVPVNPRSSRSNRKRFLSLAPNTGSDCPLTTVWIGSPTLAVHDRLARQRLVAGGLTLGLRHVHAHVGEMANGLSALFRLKERVDRSGHDRADLVDGLEFFHRRFGESVHGLTMLGQFLGRSRAHVPDVQSRQNSRERGRNSPAGPPCRGDGSGPPSLSGRGQGEGDASDDSRGLASTPPVVPP